MEKLNLFFSRIKELSFWQRLFSWQVIRSLSYDAFEEFCSFEKTAGTLRKDQESLTNQLTEVKTKYEGLQGRVSELEKTIVSRDGRITAFENEIKDLDKQRTDLMGELSKHNSLKDMRAGEYEKKIAQLDQIKNDLDAERRRLGDERLLEQEERHQKMRRQWAEHESQTKQFIKLICQKHAINYIEKVPFKGNPDNTLEICGEYIVFDAKSPANDDLSNFPKYLRDQAEKAEKYAKQENVKKDIYLVIPSGTLQDISQLVFNMGDYNVYVISREAFEPVILSLQKIEQYEFADKLSPEDRDSICRIIGKFTHATKRKIQIDQYFAAGFIELLRRCENDLPGEFSGLVAKYEISDRINPPQEKREKQILTKDLLEKNNTLTAEANVRGVEVPESFEDIKKLK